MTWRTLSVSPYLQESRDAFRSQVYTAGTPASFTISVKDIYGNTRKVGRRRLTLLKPVLKAPMVSALETTMC